MTYYLQHMEDVQMIGLKNKVVGLESRKYMKTFSRYNFRCNPDLRIGKAACRWIPCTCLARLEMLKTP